MSHYFEYRTVTIYREREKEDEQITSEIGLSEKNFRLPGKKLRFRSML